MSPAPRLVCVSEARVGRVVGCVQFLLGLVCGCSSAGFKCDTDNAGRQPAAGFQFRLAASVSFMFSAVVCKAEFKGFSD